MKLRLAILAALLASTSAHATVGTPPIAQGFSLQDGVWLNGLAGGQNYLAAFGIVAAGTTHAGATQLNPGTQLVEIDTVPANSGVALPPAVQGAMINMYNATATAVTIYPAILNNEFTATQDTINGLISFSLPAETSILFATANTGLWGTSGVGVSTFSAGSTGLTPSTATTGAVTLGGTLNVAHGGIGDTTLTNHGLLIGSGTSPVTVSAAMTAGQLAVGQGSSADPLPKTITGDGTLAASGALTIASIGGEAVTLGGAFTTSGAYNLTLTLTGATNVTLPTTGTLISSAGGQTIANLTVSGTVTGGTFVPSSASGPTAGVYLPAAGLLGLIGTTSELFSGTTDIWDYGVTTGSTLTIPVATTITGQLTATAPNWTGSAGSVGNPSEANVLAATGIGAILNLASSTVNDTASTGTVAQGAMAAFRRPTWTATNATTVTDMATVLIGNSPICSTNVTCTNIHSLYVPAGDVTFNGTSHFGSNMTVNGPFLVSGSGPTLAAGQVSLSNGVPTLGATNEAGLYSSATGGGVVIGEGSTYDASLANNANSIAMGVLTGTTNVKFVGSPVLTQSTPADNATCSAGQLYVDTGFIYACTASGTVKRATLSTY